MSNTVAYSFDSAFRFPHSAFLILFILFAAAPRPARAQGALPLPLQNVSIDPKLGTTIPLDLTFNDETGHPVQLRSFFKSEKPVILTLVYFECPMLCTLVLNSLTTGLKGLPWTPGDQFEIVTVSFNPKEGPDLAKGKKESYLRELGREGAGAGWHFLTGREDQIKPLADSVGFKYVWVPEQNQFAHAAGIFILSPEGKLTRTLFGIDYPARDLRLGLTEAAAGKVGTMVDKVLLFCYHYDPQKKGYTVAAFKVMQLAGSLTAIILFSTIGAFLWFERRQRRRAALQAAEQPAPPQKAEIKS